jgi:hypothetical protein
VAPEVWPQPAFRAGPSLSLARGWGLFNTVPCYPRLRNHTDNAKVTMPPRPIPIEISDPFGEALVLLVQWRGGQEEPCVLLDGKSLKIGSIFELVARRAFKDEIPESMRKLLQAYASRDKERLKEIAELILVPTYETAARCLLKWVELKRSKLGK